VERDKRRGDGSSLPLASLARLGLMRCAVYVARELGWAVTRVRAPPGRTCCNLTGSR
jgi:hypothetical protein